MDCCYVGLAQGVFIANRRTFYTCNSNSTNYNTQVGNCAPNPGCTVGTACLLPEDSTTLTVEAGLCGATTSGQAYGVLVALAAPIGSCTSDSNCLTTATFCSGGQCYAQAICV